MLFRFESALCTLTMLKVYFIAKKVGKMFVKSEYYSYICSVIQMITGADTYMSALMTRKGS